MKRTLLFFILWTAIAATADDGSRLWLRYSITPSPTTSVQFEQDLGLMVNQSDRAIIDNALEELVQHWLGLPLLLRLTGVGLLVMTLIVSADEYFAGATLTDVYDAYFGILIFSVFNLIVAEAFAIGLKLQEEQDLTI